MPTMANNHHRRRTRMAVPHSPAAIVNDRTLPSVASSRSPRTTGVDQPIGLATAVLAVRQVSRDFPLARPTKVTSMDKPDGLQLAKKLCEKLFPGAWRTHDLVGNELCVISGSSPLAILGPKISERP